MTHRFSSLFIIFLCLSLTACGGRENRDAPRQVGRSIVIGMTSDGIQLSAFENIFANTLRTEGDLVCLVATGLPQLRAGITADNIRSAAEAANASHVIINRMIPVSARDGSAGNLDNYVASITPIQRVNGDEGVIESRVFSVETGNLLWSRWSSKVNPRGRLKDLADEAQDLADDLAGDNIIKPIVVESLESDT